MNMKRNIARTLALMLVLCTLLSQTALAATTYYVDVTITGPDADGVERTAQRLLQPVWHDEHAPCIGACLRRRQQIRRIGEHFRRNRPQNHR